MRSFDPQAAKAKTAAAIKGFQAAMEGLLTTFDMVERERGPDGTFVADQTGGLDPTTMKQAYGPKKPSKAKLALAAGLAAAGGAGVARWVRR